MEWLMLFLLIIYFIMIVLGWIIKATGLMLISSFIMLIMWALWCYLNRKE